LQPQEQIAVATTALAPYYTVPANYLHSYSNETVSSSLSTQYQLHSKPMLENDVDDWLLLDVDWTQRANHCTTPV